VALARDAIASGAAKAKLHQLVTFTRGFAKPA
jgi:anthranilate phosphoribosyltransferase